MVEALVVSFDSGTWQATVRLLASEGGIYAAVPASRGLPAAALVAGARCLVWAVAAAPANWIVVAVV